MNNGILPPAPSWASADVKLLPSGLFKVTPYGNALLYPMGSKAPQRPINGFWVGKLGSAMGFQRFLAFSSGKPAFLHHASESAYLEWFAFRWFGEFECACAFLPLHCFPSDEHRDTFVVSMCFRLSAQLPILTAWFLVIGSNRLGYLQSNTIWSYLW